jgi:hypothetical protein
MSLTDNTTSLRSILSAVNELPEAGGGGVEVQRKSGSVSLTGNNTTVNCGFKPDVLFLTLNESYEYDQETFQYCTGVVFGELATTDGRFDMAMFGVDYTYVYETWGKRTNTGFTAGYQCVKLSDSSTSSPSKSFSYVAIKYT